MQLDTSAPLVPRERFNNASRVTTSRHLEYTHTIAISARSEPRRPHLGGLSLKTTEVEELELLNRNTIRNLHAICSPNPPRGERCLPTGPSHPLRLKSRELFFSPPHHFQLSSAVFPSIRSTPFHRVRCQSPHCRRLLQS